MIGLEAFERIANKYGADNTLEGTYNDALIIKKELVALEIIVLKEVDMYRVRVSKSTIDYNQFIKEERKLTPDEFELVKWVNESR